ncbi:MAG: hypothetical protein KAY37_11595 [Phycisphaerae bacterium]|nr:hypothetical protein [Phycisphaerae bacterium]
MRAAGHLHNLGKLSVPTSILDTIGGRPQIREWAAFHHERLDGAVWREAW